MADLQAEIELTVELRKFINIDLFVQGYYQIRLGVKCASRVQLTNKIELKSEFPCSTDEANEQIYPACVFEQCGISKTFLIIYKNEEVHLDDQINFKLSVIVDAQNLTDSFNRMDLQLFVELYFIEKDYSPEKLSTMQQLCSRMYKLHFNPRFGIHTHLPILFDYFHLSALTTTIHAALLCLIPPSGSDRPNVRRTSLFSFLFGQDLAQITTDQLNPALLDRAYQLHNHICEILLSSYESLQDFYEKMLDDESKTNHTHQKCRQKLRNLCEKLKVLDDIHTIDNLAHAHIAQCSAENIMLWCQFIQTFTLNDRVATVLAKEYHLKRVKRLSEGFFLRETSRINLLTNESKTFNDLHDLVRNSSYYSRLPHLTIECVELDGLPDTLPILIEEVYSPIDEEIRPLPTTTRKLSEDKLVRPSTTNASASPKLPSTSKNVLSFRKQTSKGVNPVLALSNDSSVRLTSFKKMNETSTNLPQRRSFQRSNSSSQIEDFPTDSSPIPSFLRSPTTEKIDDEVFDTSLKSKVLQNSFRGKRNTMDRRTVSLSNFSPENRSSSVSTQSPTTNHVDPLMLNGLTKDENERNLREKNGDEEQEENSSPHQDRIQHNSNINSQTIDFVVQKEKLKELIQSKCSANLMFYSDFSTPICTTPYFRQDLVPLDSNDTHLIICVHGLDGNSGDLRLVKTYLELCLPSCRLEFLMSSSNHSSTFDDIDIMVKQLIDEIDSHIDRYGLKLQRMSFIGHSLGNLIVRATVGHERFERYRSLLYTYLSLSGPHLGTLFNSSGLVNMGMWIMQKWRKSCSLSQMSFRDHVDPKQTYLYKLSKKPCFEYFKNILLIASPQDRYVPFHSARIEVCKAALRDTSYGSIYVEMINNLLTPILRNPSITFVRYNAFHNIPSGTNTLIGRAAHIAILDLELFVEKLILVSAAKYFK